MPLLLPLAALVAALFAASASAQVDNARAKALAWLVVHQEGDGHFESPRGLPVQATAAAVEAMLAGGLTRSPQHNIALAWLANAAQGSTDAEARRALALAAAGRDALRFGTALHDNRNVFFVTNAGGFSGGAAAWGPYAGYGNSIADTALAYGALRRTNVGSTTDLTLTVLCAVLPAQIGGTGAFAGSWPQALPVPNAPAVVGQGNLVSTALMLAELKANRQAGRFLTGSACAASSPAAIDAAMSSAKTWLLAQRNADGGFAERNVATSLLEPTNPLASALALRALQPFASEGDAAAQSALSVALTWLAGQRAAKSGG